MKAKLQSAENIDSKELEAKTIKGIRGKASRYLTEKGARGRFVIQFENFKQFIQA